MQKSNVTSLQTRAENDVNQKEINPRANHVVTNQTKEVSKQIFLRF